MIDDLMIGLRNSLVGSLFARSRAMPSTAHTLNNREVFYSGRERAMTHWLNALIDGSMVFKEMKWSEMYPC